ncbi:MAG: acyl-CoA reductase [Verrucomicrobiota bacterium]
MNLPNYFLADLPPEATLSPAMVTEACRTLKRNRARYLAQRSTHSLVGVLCDVAEAWLKPDNTFRRLALESGPEKTGFSRATLQKGLDNFFHQFTPENFQALLMQELGDAVSVTGDVRRVTGETVTSRHSPAGPKLLSEGRSRVKRHFWRGPELLVHITAGNLPNPALMSIVLGLLSRSAQFVKCASGSMFLPRLFAHSIYDADTKLGACLEIAEWRGGNADLETVLFAEADCVTTTGSDETLAAIRARLPVKTRFLGYGHRVSFGFVAHEVLSGLHTRQIVSRTTDDVVAWNQLGCLSPHVVYVQTGGEVSPEKFAELLADELERREQTEPRGELPAGHAAAIASRRGIYEVRAAHSPETTQHWCSRNSTAWTVVYEADARFQLSCLNRFIYVKPVRDLAEALHHAETVRGQVSTVGLGVLEHKLEELATQLARWGVTRVCPLGRMQNPPLTWRHDGRPALGDLVTWTDFEE